MPINQKVTMKFRYVAVAAAVLLATGAGIASADTFDSDRDLPLPYDGDADQVVTVVAPDSQSTDATITAWQRTSSGWKEAVGPVKGYVGEDGVGKASETVAKTPQGVWTLTEAFGNLPANNTALPYRQIDDADWWVSDVESQFYNTHQRCETGSCPFDESAGENLASVGTAYDRSVVIDYNRNPPVPGNGSAFFLHVSTGGPTAGCVSIPAADLDELMTWLEPHDEPVINIGIAK
jgi:L,D-peptidoglycan transpeptidase YkuD (ErfK/YbiS/YcfS/YnhG family)